MRILHVVHQYLPASVGGTEIYTQTLVSAQNQRGCTAAVFTPQADLDQILVRDESSGAPVFLARSLETNPVIRFWDAFGDNSLTRAFSDSLATFEPDLVHVHHLMGLPARILDLVRERGLPIVATLHDYWFLCANAQLLTNYDQTVCAGPRLWLNCARCAAARLRQPALNVLAPAVAAVIGWRARLLRQAMGQIDFYVAPTEFVRALFVRAGLVQPEQIVHVPHGIALDGVRPHGTRPAGAPLRVSYLGGVSWQKGVHVLVEAVKRLPSGLAQLTILGDLAAFPEYARELVAQAAGRDEIRFAGKLDRAGVWQALSETDVLVVPSLWYETAALVIQEAFAAGVPVIASDLGALSERVEHGCDGFLFPAGDTAALSALLERLAIDPDLLSQLRSGIRPVVTMDQHLSQILALYGRFVPAGAGCET